MMMKKIVRGENITEGKKEKKRKKKPVSRGLMQDKEKEKMKLNSNEEGGERIRTRVPQRSQLLEHNAFVDRNELLDNETL